MPRQDFAKPSNLSSSPTMAGSAKHADVRSRFDRRPSVEIAQSFVELNLKAVIDADNEAKLSDADRVKIERAEHKKQRKANRRRHRVRNLLVGLLLVVLIAVGCSIVWWNTVTSAVNVADKNEYQFTVNSGSSVEQVASSLQKANFIRNSLAFRLYARFNDITIHAGTFNLSPSNDMSTIANKLSSNQTAVITVTVAPGLTLKELSAGAFKKAGFGSTDIATALNAKYDDSILSGRPANASLEGYIFPETYSIGVNDNLQSLISQSLAQLAKIAKKDNLQAGFAKHGLNFYEGVTLASIVTKEVSNPIDQKKVAGVFYNRLQQGMDLQSDTTFLYAYDQGLCGTDDTSCDSNYNTYRDSGLPPGPISNPSESALKAVADPIASGNLYFFADTNGVCHYETTLSAQQADIAQYGLSGSN